VPNYVYQSQPAQMKNAQWLEMERIFQDRGGTERVKTILKYIVMNMGYSYKGDSVVYYPHYNKSNVYFLDSLIATVDKRNQMVHLPAYSEVQHTRAVKELVNRILMRFCGCQLFQKQGVWYIAKPFEDNMEIKGQISIPFHCEEE
jgi:hypothetical protein